MASSSTLRQQAIPASHPIILDVTLHSYHAAYLFGASEEREEGLLAGSEASKDLLSMSGYGRSQYPDAKDFETSRPLEDSMYMAYVQGHSMVQPSMQSAPLSYARQSSQATYGPSALFQGRPADDAPSAYASLRTQRIPEVTDWAPQQGDQGTQVLIYLTATVELNPTWAFHATFGSHRAECALTRLENQGSYYNYVLSADAPDLPPRSYSLAPVVIYALDELGNSVAGVRVGNFTYTDIIHHSPQASPEISRKRKMSNDTNTSEISAKRTNTRQVRSGSGESYERPYAFAQQAPAYLHSNALAESPIPTHLGTSYQSTSDHATQLPQRRDSPREVSHHLVSNPSTSATQRGPGPQTPCWNTAGGPGPPSRSPNVSVVSSSRVATGTSPNMANPPLIRTTALPQTPSPAATPSGTPGGSQFNPYGIYTNNKAVLKINGELEDMPKEWTREERESQRRLVQFERSQSGNTINTSFKPVAPEERQPNSICVSCIWWEAKEECYVTSVDTISLLESLIAVRFTVDEKNRIRRNLEGFRPLTVSKGKADSEDFFKLIMAFPNPKPRNIEKDVKAFPWRILAHALKKIIGKYSASYSSTASALPTSGNSGYRTGPQHDMGPDMYPTSSPYSVAEPTISTPYSHGLPLPSTPNMQSNTAQGRVQMPYSSAGTSMVMVAPTPAYPLYQYAPQNQLGHTSGRIPMVSGQPHSQQQQQQQRPPSWDFGPYLDQPTSGTAEHAMYALETGQHETGQYDLPHVSSGA